MKQRHITIWNIIALLVIVAGGGGTWLAGLIALDLWVESGLKHPVGQWSAVTLPAGALRVHYESRHDVPGPHTQITVRDPTGRLIRMDRIHKNPGFESGRIRDVSIQETFVVEVDAPGRHEVFFLNSTYNPDELPEDDRVAWIKHPATMEAAIARRNFVLVCGGAISGSLAILCYVLHFRTLTYRRVRLLVTQLPDSPLPEPEP